MADTLRSLVFRVPVKVKNDFKMALLRHDVNVQNFMEGILEAVIAYDRGEKDKDPVGTAFLRARALASKQ